MNIQFLGAAGEVTGSKHLITTRSGKRILLDCGMFQGKGVETDSANRNLGFDPARIDYLILSHAHIDHSGLIPYMYRLGFRGSIIATAATRDLCSIMLVDSAYIQELDAKYYNKKALKKHLPRVEPIYTVDVAEQCMDLFISVAYNRRFRIDDELSVKFFNNGHMLGSGVVCLDILEAGELTRLAYTGDIGRPRNNILRAPEAFPQCDYLIAESTYGDRLHEEEPMLEQDFLRIVYHTCVEKRGKLLIPSFSVGRTQEIVYVLNKFYNAGVLPKINVYVDSPLSVNATEVFRMHTDAMNDGVRATMMTDPDPFGFNSLHYITDVRKSKELNTMNDPCIIISASGMLEAGRIKHHVANNIEKASTTILIVGYCTPSSLGARLQEPGLKKISIFGEEHTVNAEIERIEAFSGHGDYREMIDYLKCQDPSAIRKVFLVHGEHEVQKVYKGHLEENGFQNIELPQQFDSFEI